MTETLAAWVAGLGLSDLPPDIVEASEQRILDVIGLALVGQRFDIGAAILRGGRRLGGPAEAHIVGQPDVTGMATAALVNGALAEAIEYDDTHNESVVHVGAAVVAAALAAGEAVDASGADLLAAVAGGSEATCRLALIAPGQFHPRGFHPTGIFCPFGAVYAAGRVQGHSARVMTTAAGIAGSQAAGLLACWADGTWAKALHPGWAAHSAIVALQWAEAGFTGPSRVIEDPSGLIASHVQDSAARLDYPRAVRDLGWGWESRTISFKPYPAAHVLHGLIEAALVLSGQVDIEAIETVTCGVAPHWSAIVCDPLDDKRRPPTSAAARISLPHTIAEALVRGRVDGDSYGPDALADPRIRALAEKVTPQVEPSWTDRAVFPGRLRIRLRDGRELAADIAANLGGAQRPLSHDQIAEKFHRNAAGRLSARKAEAICVMVGALRHGARVRDLMRQVH